MPAAADNAFRLPYAVAAILVTVLVALGGGWASSAQKDSDKETRISVLEAYKVDHEKKTAELLAEFRAINITHERRMAENFDTQAAQNAELQKTLTELRIVVARQRP